MTNSYPFVVSVDKFKGKRVLVTSGTKGIGAAIARRFELSGASVATTASSAAAVRSPLLRCQCARSRRLQCGDLLQALALRIKSALRTLRVRRSSVRSARSLQATSRWQRMIVSEMKWEGRSPRDALRSQSPYEPSINRVLSPADANLRCTSWERPC
jgi:hypothetical protein